MLEQAFKAAFVNFLKEHNVYEQYLQKLKEENVMNPVDLDYLIKLEISTPSDIILASFIWNKYENKDLWRDLDFKWRNYCRSISY